MRYSSLALLPLVSVLVAATAHAEDLPPAAQPEVFQSVIDCRKLADSAERLACYDRTVATLDTAAQAKDVLVVDKKTVRETKRGLFGLSLPRIKIFGQNDDVDISQIDSTITAISTARDGFSIFVLADGGRWKQTDGRFTFPKPGQPITIKRGALGGFLANVNKQPGVRVMRLPEQN